jgi:hypothetical protein
VTRYDLFRRRIAPIAFGVAIVLLARESCTKHEHADATFAFDFGSAAQRVQSIDVDVYEHGEPYSHFHRDALDRSDALHRRAARSGRRAADRRRAADWRAPPRTVISCRRRCHDHRPARARSSVT